MKATREIDRSGSERTNIDLIRRIARGEEEALVRLHSETKKMVYNTALRILRCPASAEEITSDVFLQVWQRASTYDEQRGSVLSWVLMRARSRAIDRLRASRATSEVSELSEEQDLESGERTDPERMSLLAELRRYLRAALSHLDPNQRELIEKAFFGGHTHREMSEGLDIPLGTIKTRIRLGLRHLREVLAPLEPANF